MPGVGSNTNSEECERVSSQASRLVSLLSPIYFQGKNRILFPTSSKSKLFDILPIRSQMRPARSVKSTRFRVYSALSPLPDLVEKLELKLLSTCGMIRKSEKRSLVGRVERGSSACVRAWQSRRAVHSLGGSFLKNTRVPLVNLFGVTLRLNEKTWQPRSVL
jgi:hypothetical protein